MFELEIFLKFYKKFKVMNYLNLGLWDFYFGIIYVNFYGIMLFGV